MLAAKAFALSLFVVPVQYQPQQPESTLGGPGALKTGQIFRERPATCPDSNGPPRVEVAAERDEPTYSRAESIAGLTGKSAAGNAYRPEGTTGPAWHTQGLTQSSFEFDHNIPYITTDLGNGLFCIQVQSVEMKIILRPQVWVANEFPPGSCMYNAVKEHENKHVNVDRITTDRHLPQFRAALTEVSQNQGVFGPASYIEVNQELNQFVQEVLNVAGDETDRMQAEDNRAQRMVDTLQEYRRVAAECPAQKW